MVDLAEQHNTETLEGKISCDFQQSLGREARFKNLSDILDEFILIECLEKDKE